MGAIGSRIDSPEPELPRRNTGKGTTASFQQRSATLHTTARTAHLRVAMLLLRKQHIDTHKYHAQSGLRSFWSFILPGYVPGITSPVHTCASTQVDWRPSHAMDWWYKPRFLPVCSSSLAHRPDTPATADALPARHDLPSCSMVCHPFLTPGRMSRSRACMAGKRLREDATDGHRTTTW